MPGFRRAAFAAELARPEGSQSIPASVDETIDGWREAAQLTPAGFADLLAAEGIDRGELAQRICARDRVPSPVPPWRATLDAVLRRIAAGTAAASLAPPAAEDPPFATVLDSFVAVGWDDLRARAPSAGALDIDWTCLAPRLQAHLRTLLLQICQRTLVLELHIARLEGWLEGDTPEARYAYYVAALRDRREVWLRLLDEYQAMARLLCTAIAAWAAALCELLGHLIADLPQLTGAASAGGEALLPAAPRLRLVSLVGGLSDPHRGGRGVWKLGFVEAATGEAGPHPLALVYKPRSLALDAHFQALLAFCNTRARSGALHLADLRHARPAPAAGFPELRLLRVLDAGDHGWAELVHRCDCDDGGAAARFYLRQGGFLALLYVLDGADIHYENLIASGEHPMLVDLETLFHPWVQVSEASSAPRDARARGDAILRDSVTRTALLPGRIWGDRERAGVNIGGLGDGRTQRSPQGALDWALTRTDAMHATERRLELAPGDNLPRVAGRVVPVAHHVEELVAGFEAMLRLVIAERTTLLGPGGAIRAFAGDPMRRLLRATSAYSRLLEASYHPDHLRDALDRERLFDLLWTASRGKPRLLRAVAHERQDLCGGDVPYFAGRPNSCDLWDSRGAPITGFLPAPPIDIAAAQLAGLGERQIAEQVFVIRATVSASSIASAEAPARSPSPLASRGPSALDAAISIGDQLAATAVLGERDATWLGMDASRDGAGVDVAPLRGGLYDGTGGIALFLGYLGQLTGEARFTRLAARAAQLTRASLADDDPPGGFAGAPSQLYALAHLAVLWGDPALVPALGPILDRTAARIAADPAFDVIYGAAGAILALLAIHDLTGDDQALAVAVAAGRAVTAGAHREARGASWPCSVSARHLLGFSHGAAGIGAALYRLAGVAARRPELGGDAAALSALGAAAFEFERGHFDPAAGNWPDLRDDPPKHMLAFCHGAPGIALARLAAPLAPDSWARREVETAIATTLSGAIQRGQTLCHGELGNLMIVSRAAGLLGRADWQAEVDRRLAVTLGRLHDRGPAVTFDFAPSAPALMDGIAGIGYGLLALSHPGALPFVLDLSPVQRGAAPSIPASLGAALPLPAC